VQEVVAFTSLAGNYFTYRRSDDKSIPITADERVYTYRAIKKMLQAH